MVIPFIPIAAGLAASGLIGGAISDAIYTYNKNKEIDRMWSDYYKNTGWKPRYPYRVGARYNYAPYFYDVGRLGMGMLAAGKGYRSWRKYKHRYWRR